MTDIAALLIACITILIYGMRANQTEVVIAMIVSIIALLLRIILILRNK